MERPDWNPGDTVRSVTDVCAILGAAAVEVAKDTKVWLAVKMGQLAERGARR